MTHISTLVGNDPIKLVGAGGNIYVVCHVRSALELICLAIGKAQSSIYMSDKHNCYAIRVKTGFHKGRLKEQNIKTRLD